MSRGIVTCDDELPNRPFDALLMKCADGTLKRQRKRSPTPDHIPKLAFAMTCTLVLLNEMSIVHEASWVCDDTLPLYVIQPKNTIQDGYM